MAKNQALRKTVAKKPVKASRPQTPRESVSPYDKWAVWLFLAIVVVVPLIFSRISYDQFDLVKLAVFRSLVAIIVIVWAAKMLTKSGPVVWSRRELFLVAFLLLGAVSVLTAIHIPTALHGKYKRYEGILTFLTYITAYLIAMQTFKNKKQFRTLVEAISVTGGLVALYGIMQYIGADPIYWGQLPFEARRSFSTFGNPDLLAGYLVIAFPCALVAYFDSQERSWLHGAAASFLIVDLLMA